MNKDEEIQEDKVEETNEDLAAKKDANLLNTSPMSDKIAQIQSQRAGSKSIKYYRGLRTKH